MGLVTVLRTIGLATLVFVSNASTAQKGSDEGELVMLAKGSVKAEGAKLDSCAVTVFLGNEIVASQITSKSGKYELMLKKDQEYGIVFKREGYVPKRIMVDTHAKITSEEYAQLRLDMVLNMMKAEKFDGANTDALDFPFAILKYDRKLNAFLEDPAYTAGVMRTNGALLLVAGRSSK